MSKRKKRLRVIDLSDLETHRKIEKSLNEDQLAWVNKILFKSIDEFKKHLNHFNENVT